MTPEEDIRQIMLKRLVQEEYEYPKEWIKTEFKIQKGSKRIGPADIVVFKDGKKSKDQENIWIIFKTEGEKGYDMKLIKGEFL